MKKALAFLILAAIVSNLFASCSFDFGGDQDGNNSDSETQAAANEALEENAQYREICEGMYNVFKNMNDYYAYHDVAFDAVSKAVTTLDPDDIAAAKAICLDSYNAVLACTPVANPGESDSSIYSFMMANSLIPEDFDVMFNNQSTNKYYTLQSIMIMIYDMLYLETMTVSTDDYVESIQTYIEYNTQYTNIEKKVDMLWINHFFCPTEGETESLFRRDYLPGLDVYYGLNLKWINSQSELEDNANILLSSAEDLVDEYADYVYEIEYKLTYENAEVRNSLVANGYSEDEAQQLITSYRVAQSEAYEEYQKLLEEYQANS